MKKLIAAFFLISVLSTSGCATLNNKLPIVISAVTDGVLVIDSINSFANDYFTNHPNPAKQAQIADLTAKAKTALDAALRIANGASDIDQAKIDEAFAEFRTVYTELAGLVQSIGIETSSANKLAAAPGKLLIPTPLALTLKAGS